MTTRKNPFRHQKDRGQEFLDNFCGDGIPAAPCDSECVACAYEAGLAAGKALTEAERAVAEAARSLLQRCENRRYCPACDADTNAVLCRCEVADLRTAVDAALAAERAKEKAR